jgi:hypothetical protein
MMVRLNRQDMALSEQAGALRWQLARASQTKDQAVDKSRDPKQMDRLGLRAEICVAKALNVDFSAATLGIDSGGDLFIPIKDNDFFTVQVKSTFHKNGNLIFKRNEKFNFDVAILVCAQTQEPDCDYFEITGALGISNINTAKYETDMGKGQMWRVDREDLRPVCELWNHIQQQRLA